MMSSLGISFSSYFCMVIPYREPLGSIFKLQDQTERFPTTSVTNYHYTLRNIPEEQRFHLQ